MDAKQLFERAEKSRQEAKRLLDEANAADEKGEGDVAELQAKARKLVDEGHALYQRAELAEQVAEGEQREEARRLTEAKAERRHMPADLAEQARGDKPVTEAQLKERNRLNRDMHRKGVRSLSEAEAAQAQLTFAEEKIFPRYLITKADKMEDLSPEEADAWRHYQDVAQRTMEFGTAAQGGSLAPENWSNEIVASMAYVGGSADFNRLMVEEQPGVNKFHVPTITDSHAKQAQEAAEGAAVTLIDYATGDVELGPRRRAVVVEVTVDLVSATRFREWLGANVGDALGRKVNDELTNGGGSGSNQAIGAATVTAGQGNVTAGGTYSEADASAHFQAIDHAYLMGPGAMLQVHSNTQKEMWFDRDTTGGNLTFRGAQASQDLVLPGNVPVVLNNALSAATTAGEVIALLVNGMKYQVVRALGLKVDVGPLNVRTQKFDLSWTMWYDGAPTDTRAFRRRRNP